MIHSGQPARDFIDSATRHVLLRQGVLGIKVKIMRGSDPDGKSGPQKSLPDTVTVIEPKEEAPIGQPSSQDYVSFLRHPDQFVQPKSNHFMRLYRALRLKLRARPPLRHRRPLSLSKLVSSNRSLRMFLNILLNIPLLLLPPLPMIWVGGKAGINENNFSQINCSFLLPSETTRGRVVLQKLLLNGCFWDGNVLLYVM